MSAIDKVKDHFTQLDTGESLYIEAWDLKVYKQPLQCISANEK